MEELCHSGLPLEPPDFLLFFRVENTSMAVAVPVTMGCKHWGGGQEKY